MYHTQPSSTYLYDIYSSTQCACIRTPFHTTHSHALTAHSLSYSLTTTHAHLHALDCTAHSSPIQCKCQGIKHRPRPSAQAFLGFLCGIFLVTVGVTLTVIVGLRASDLLCFLLSFLPSVRSVRVTIQTQLFIAFVPI